MTLTSMSNLNSDFGDDRLCKVREAAEMLSVGVSTVYQMHYDGRLEAVKIGRSLRIRMRTLRRLMTHGTRSKGRTR